MGKTMKTKFDNATATRAAARKAHFENGGTLGMWRGCAATFTDRKHKANKAACRNFRAEG